MRNPDTLRRIRVIDSHTAGEPTRVVVDGGPDLGSGPLAGRRDRFRRKFDQWRSAIVNEPRGSDTVVGALLCTPADASCTAAVIFFNNVGYLGMCGHGTIGLITTLAYLKRITTGKHRIETPVGIVSTELHHNGEVSVTNVPAYRHRKDVTVEVDGVGSVTGDIVWGGNWFFLVSNHGQELRLENAGHLTDLTWRIRHALKRHGITGANGAEIDHVELFGPPHRPDADSRNFVLCPGGAYDRSPCGTGTCAKLACLYEDGLLPEGRPWRQEGIVGGVFEGHVAVVDGAIHPTIRGSAYITAEATLLLDEDDPLCWGIRSNR